MRITLHEAIELQRPRSQADRAKLEQLQHVLSRLDAFLKEVQEFANRDGGRQFVDVVHEKEHQSQTVLEWHLQLVHRTSDEDEDMHTLGEEAKCDRARSTVQHHLPRMLQQKGKEGVIVLDGPVPVTEQVKHRGI